MNISQRCFMAGMWEIRRNLHHFNHEKKIQLFGSFVYVHNKFELDGLFEEEASVMMILP